MRVAVQSVSDKSGKKGLRVAAIVQNLFTRFPYFISGFNRSRVSAALCIAFVVYFRFLLLFLWLMSEVNFCMESVYKAWKHCSIQNMLYVEPMRNIWASTFDHILFRLPYKSSRHFVKRCMMWARSTLGIARQCSVSGISTKLMDFCTRGKL